MADWNLITLDAAKIFRNLTVKDIVQCDGNYVIDFRYDLSDSLSRDVILSEDVFSDNALFFQLRRVLSKAQRRDDPDLLREAIVFVDFKEIFANEFSPSTSYGDIPAKADLLSERALPHNLNRLFTNGLSLSFYGETFKRFVPFDKSSSMARSCRITFIDEQLKTVLDKRLMLDMDFLGAELELSKFYAYRGLYLSAAFRLDNLPLNEETVVVVPDYKISLPQKTFTAEPSSRKDYWEFVTAEKSVTVKLFDGEGLLSPDFAERMSNALKSTHHFVADSHSFQIRLPFTKGVLHAVDFNRFFSEQLQNVPDKLLIKDIFGIPRDLRRAKIILTRSMFKCASWMLDSHAFEPDPMKYFFEKFAEYDHAIYVANTEARLSNSGRVKLNYQFLSTLALTAEDFDSIVAEQMRTIDSFSKDFSDTCKNSPGKLSRATCLQAVTRNPAFLRDPKVKNIHDDMLRTTECNLGLGRLEVAGEQRFLSCDLLLLLIEILTHLENVVLDDASKAALKSQCLYRDRFFMPCGRISITPDKHYAFLRNPHLSRNEQVLLRAFVKRKSLHEKYFAHLKGVIMVSGKSTAALRLGGADFDGDLVKVVADERIVQAVKRGNIDADLPPVEIPAAAPVRLPLGRSIPLSVIVNTFANKIGYVSDLAVKLAQEEYSESPAAAYKNACARCTIVVGLEIDAAKTGIHPEQNIEELKTLASHCSKNVFLDAKEKIEKILEYDCSPVVVQQDNAFVLYLSTKARDCGLSTMTVSFDKTSFNALERLPATYLKFLHERTVAHLTDDATPTRFFAFETPGWRKKISDENLRGQLSTLVKSYLRILSLDRKTRYLKRIANQTKFNGHILNILRLQYDDLRQKLLCGTEIADALNQLYAELSFVLQNATSVKNSLKQLKDRNWHLTVKDNRPAVAAQILGLEPYAAGNLPGVFELLYNFDCNGFMIFYYVLKELQIRLYEEPTEIAAPKSTEESDFNQSPCYREMYELYSSSVAAKKSKPIWNAQLVEICRRRLKEIFDGDMFEALKYFWSRRSEDSGRNFFWNVFGAQEILSHI